MYNVANGATSDRESWGFRRSWTPMSASNQDLDAVLDVYLLIGHEAMSDAYRAAFPLRPDYGVPLAQSARCSSSARQPTNARPSSRSWPP